MKKHVLSAIAGAVGMLLLLTIILNISAAKEQKPEKYEHIDYVSTITRVGCFVYRVTV